MKGVAVSVIRLCVCRVGTEETLFSTSKSFHQPLLRSDPRVLWFLSYWDGLFLCNLLCEN